MAKKRDKVTVVRVNPLRTGYVKHKHIAVLGKRRNWLLAKLAQDPKGRGSDYDREEIHALEIAIAELKELYEQREKAEDG